MFAHCRDDVGRASGLSLTRRTIPGQRSDTDPMRDLWDETDDDDVSPICPACGVSTLPPEVPGEPSMCENPNCSAFGEAMDR